MDLAELTVSRRTVHAFTAEKIADRVVEEALELALWAPNHKLTFPWAFFWIGEQVRLKLADLAVELKAKKETLSELKTKTTREVVLNPSHLIVLATKRGDPTRAHEDYATLACGVQIATLSLWSHGVFSKWSTGGFSMHLETYKLLEISPEEYQLEGILLIGKAAEIPPPPARPALTQFLRRTK